MSMGGGALTLSEASVRFPNCGLDHHPSRVVPTTSSGSILWELVGMQNPDLLSQNLPVNTIPRRLVGI